ncbi:MAG: hypothetical protein ACMXYG_06930 [Candidatus Woesearchaeota archaeon]
MVWKKLLDTNEVIAYEKKARDKKIRLEARFRKNRWRIYKTYNFNSGDNWITHVKEYIACSLDETRNLLLELKKEKDVTLSDFMKFNKVNLDLQRCYKEEFVEKWKLAINDSIEDNYVHVRFDEIIKLDIIIHSKYDAIEKVLLDKIIKSLGLRDMSNKIQYDFFYYTRHSAKRRIYEDHMDDELIAQMEFNIGSLRD